MRVHVAIPPVDELYPHAAVIHGVKALGFQTVGNDDPFGGDFLITWSPWARSRREALVLGYKRAGKPVLVMENGWLSPIKGQKMYQLAHDGWNGTGHFPSGPAYRWEKWGVSLQNWPAINEGPALVIGQRGHPWDRRSAPPGWCDNLQLDNAQVIIRHYDCSVPLVDHLAVAGEVHVWSSNCASWAMVMGVPVVHHGDNLMVAALASRPGEPLIRPYRTAEMERLAWAQWTAFELSTGSPFKRLLVDA